MWPTMLSVNIQAIHEPLPGHTSDEKIDEDKGEQSQTTD